MSFVHRNQKSSAGENAYDEGDKFEVTLPEREWLGKPTGIRYTLQMTQQRDTPALSTELL